MEKRLLILVPFTLITLVLFLIQFEYGQRFPWLFALCTVAGIYGIVKGIASSQRFKLVENILILESFLKDARAIDLATIAEWRELGYNIRGQRRMTIIPLLNNSEKVIVDNSEYKVDFDALLNYLSSNHGMQKQAHG